MNHLILKRLLWTIPLLLAAGCNRHAPSTEQSVTPVRVSPVDLYQPTGGSRYSASILPGRQVSLAFRVSGIVQTLYRAGGRSLEPGDMVGAGAVLARLRQDDYTHATSQAQGQLDAARESQRSAEAQLAQVEANLAKAQADFNRAQTLWSSASLTRPEYDSAKAQLDVSIAQVAAARAQIDSASAQIRAAEASTASSELAQVDTALVAPFAASVVERNIEVGMLAGPSAVAYTLADIGTVKAVFGVPDTALVQLHPGKKIAVTVEALPGQQFSGTVTAVAAVADLDTRLFQVEMNLPNRGLRLKPGMVAALSIDDALDLPSLPVVPLSAVVRDRDNPANFSVMVVENKVAHARQVNLGPTFGDVLAVTSGLQPGELVIHAGATLVNDGETVEVIP